LEEDEALAAELTASEKDRAENVMILDMMRNDVGKVCETGSVEVPAHFTAEKYRTVWQMTSTATGRLREGVSLREIIAATFPPSSITGAPKRRTMEIIRELEPEPRGVYTGTILLLKPGGDFVANVAIRTILVRQGQCELGVGGGIVWDSEPQKEWEEALLKAQFALETWPDLRLWETVLVQEGGECAFEQEHLARMERSARYWDFPFDREAVRSSLREYVRALRQRPAVVRMELDEQGELRFAHREAPEPRERVRLLLSGRRTDSRDRFLFHKTNRRRLYEQERRRALKCGFDEIIFCNERGHVTEGAITNLFARFGGEWVTPPVEDGLLPGIWRESFIREVGAKERTLTATELAQAEEVVVGNSVRGAMAVSGVHEQRPPRVLWRRRV